MSKTAAKKEETQVAVQEPAQLPQTVNTDKPKFLASDVIIPRMLLMQGLSDFVKERKAVAGDIVRSTDVLVLGNDKSMLDFIPLSLPVPTWTIQVKAAGAKKWEFRRIEPRTAANDTLPWTFPSDKDGNAVAPGSKENTHEGKRVKVLSLFALLPADIAAERAEFKKAADGGLPDLSKALMPILIAFRSTSYPAGKEVMTFFAQADKFKQPAWKYQLKLGCITETRDDNSYFVFKVDRAKPTAVPTEDLETVKYWAEIIEKQAASLRIDETDDGEEEAPAQPSAATAKHF